MSEKILRLENITMQFGGVIAVNNMNLEVGEGEIVSLIGPNGAGKTTAFNVITGVYQPTNGAVWFEGRKIIENTPHGKMKKLYKGQNASKYSHMIAPTPIRSPRWVLPVPSRISVYGRARPCLRTCSSPSTAAARPTC